MDRRYVLRQLEELVELCERVTGRSFDPERLAAIEEQANRAAELWTRLIEINKRVPAPYDALLEGLNYMGGMNPGRCTEATVAYLEAALLELEERVALGLGAVPKERFRLLLHGTPCWPYMRRFVELFHRWGAVFVHAPTYVSLVPGSWDLGHRYDPSRPLESMAEVMLAMYGNLQGGMDIFDMAELLKEQVREYKADGVVHHAIKSCRAQSAGMADHREWLVEAGVPALLVESDLVDPRYFSEAQMQQRVDAFLEALEQRALGRRQP